MCTTFSYKSKVTLKSFKRIDLYTADSSLNALANLTLTE